MIGLPVGINGLTLKGGGSLGGAIILFGVFIVFLVVILDRIIAKKVSLKKINRIEIIMLILGITFYSFNGREIIIDLTEKKTNYFILIENNGKLNNSEMSFSFPFDKKIKYQNNIAVINSISENYQRIDLESPDYWNSQRMQPWEMSGFKVRFYSNGDNRLSEKEIDSIIEKELKVLNN
ncbi:hypothetical protein BTO18_12340 [Polaribacter porphyrae]|uniref:Uncharacterized protein n=1 Tax=Polaribacter porphyrae TaxID=1137780 RepID=A0A2S7WRI3_9FLAO|nr:hypothetical protein BTO18_12340 [Polaribacter porphyrae]